MINAKRFFITLTLFVLVGSIFSIRDINNSTPEEMTAYVNGIKTIDDILQKRKNFANRPEDRNAKRLVNILIVAGHDDEHWGTQFGDLKEVELNRALAENLYGYLVEEEGINVMLASNRLGYNKIFENYFKREREKIHKFIDDAKLSFRKKIEKENLAFAEGNFHNVAPENAAYRLYGINRWVNNADFDLVIHIHFNDYANRKKSLPGTYTGFSIYTPGPEFDNYDLSRRLADSIFEEMKKIRPISDLPAEEDGVIEDYELIALGANESLEAGSVLVEYGYIYESIFTNPSLREVSLDNMAYATYAGIKRLLGETPESKKTKNLTTIKNKTTAHNLEWQFIKAFEGVYPADDKTLRDCPLSGYFGECSSKVQ